MLSTRKEQWGIILVGMVLGIIMMKLFEIKMWEISGMWDSGVLNQIKYETLSMNEYFAFLCEKRGKQYILICILRFMKRRKVIGAIVSLLIGCGIGISMKYCQIQYGGIGIALVMSFLLPQAPVYIENVFYMLKFDHAGQKNNAGRRKLSRETGSCILSLGVVIIGILIECYVNSIWIKIFLKHFFDNFNNML